MPNSLNQNHGKCISYLKGEFLIEILGLKGINGINVAKLGVDSLVFWASTKGNNYFGSVVQKKLHLVK